MAQIALSTDVSKWAVCPRVELDDTSLSPKLFNSEAAAKRFLNSEITPTLEAIKREAEVTGSSVKEVRARMAGRKAQLQKDRAEAKGKIRSGELDALAYPIRLRPVLNRNQGWQYPVPVSRAAVYPGTKCNRALRDALRADAVGAIPAFSMDEEIDRAFEGRSGAFTCYLDPDWGFDEIEVAAWRRLGHENNGNIGENLMAAVHDVEVAFQKLHPNASCRAVADFWRSWQVQRHIALFCDRVVQSAAAGMPAGIHLGAAEEGKRGRVHTYRLLAAFAHEVLDGEAETPPELGFSEGVAGPECESEPESSRRPERGSTENHAKRDGTDCRRWPTTVNLESGRAAVEKFVRARTIDQKCAAGLLGITEKTLRKVLNGDAVSRGSWNAIAAGLKAYDSTHLGG